MTGLIILVNILEDVSNSVEQNFLLSLCKGIKKEAFDKSIDAIKSSGCMRFLRYSWTFILKWIVGFSN